MKYLKSRVFLAELNRLLHFINLEFCFLKYFRKTRTCIHTPGCPPMIPDDLSTSNLLAAISGARLVYFDGRLHETALLVAQEVIFKCLRYFRLRLIFCCIQF